MYCHITLSKQYHHNQIHKIVLCFRSFPQDTFKIQAGAKPGSKQRQVFLFPECLLIAKRERGRSYSVKDKLMVHITY